MLYNLAYYIYIGAGRVVFGMIDIRVYISCICTIIKGIIEMQCSIMDILCAYAEKIGRAHV